MSKEKNKSELKNVVMPENVLSFKKCAEKLSVIARKKFKDDDEAGALAFCYEAERQGNITPSLYAEMAEVLFDAVLYKKAVDCWFKYLNMVKPKDFVRGYNGLGACFEMLNKNELASHYYNLQLKSKDKRSYLYDDMAYRFLTREALESGDVREVLRKMAEIEQSALASGVVNMYFDREYDTLFPKQSDSDEEDDELYRGVDLQSLATELDNIRSDLFVADPRSAPPTDDKEDWTSFFCDALSRITTEPMRAESMFSMVPSYSPLYNDAGYYKMMAAARYGNFDVALEQLDITAQVFPERVNVLYGYYFGIYFCRGEDEKAKRAFEILRDAGGGRFVDLRIFVRILVKKGKYQRAYEFAQKLPYVLPFDIKRYNLMGSTAFNVKRYQESADYFYNFYNYSHDRCSEYYREQALRGASGGKPDFDVIYDPFIFPASFNGEALARVNEFLELPAAELRKNADEAIDIFEKSLCEDDIELQVTACQSIILLNTEDSRKYLIKKLIDDRLADDAKLMIIGHLVGCKYDKLTGVVISGIYERVQFERIEFEGEKSDLFIASYAIAFGELVGYPDVKLYKLKTAAYEIHNTLSRNGGIKKLEDEAALAALIVIKSGAVSMDRETVIDHFDVDEKELKKAERLLSKK